MFSLLGTSWDVWGNAALQNPVCVTYLKVILPAGSIDAHKSTCSGLWEVTSIISTPLGSSCCPTGGNRVFAKHNSYHAGPKRCWAAYFLKLNWLSERKRALWIIHATRLKGNGPKRRIWCCFDETSWGSCQCSQLISAKQCKILRLGPFPFKRVACMLWMSVNTLWFFHTTSPCWLEWMTFTNFSNFHTAFPLFADFVIKLSPHLSSFSDDPLSCFANSCSLFGHIVELDFLTMYHGYAK